jgi:hypothetical protein
MRVNVTFTPGGGLDAGGIVVDVLRDLTIRRRQPPGTKRSLLRGIDQAHGLRAEIEARWSAESGSLTIEGFDVGASPRGSSNHGPTR